MIRYIHLKNYRSFTNLNLNLMSKNGIPLKFISIYGENGSGKSNIISVFDVLYDTFQTMNIKNMIMHLLEEHREPEYIKTLKSLNSYTDITRIIRHNKTIGSTENMVIEIGFYLNRKNGLYLLEFNNDQVIHERLEFTLTKNRGLYFDIAGNEKKISNTIFGDFKNDFIDLISRFWGKHSAISIINNAHDSFSDKYFKSNINEYLIQLLDYLNSICIYMADDNSKHGVISSNRTLSPEKYTSGEIAPSESYKLDITERMLAKYFKSMYHDIRNVFYKREQNNDSIKYELYFTRFISGKERTVHHSNESCGTRNLIYLLPYCIASTQGHVVAIDEIDNGIHDVLLINLIKALYKSISGQVIVTTHNTFLLNEYQLKDSFFFIEVNEDGERFINTPAEFGYRIQPDSNVMINYFQNRFKGLPWNDMNIDFYDISR